jgi:hypothetical protein
MGVVLCETTSQNFFDGKRYMVGRLAPKVVWQGGEIMNERKSNLLDAIPVDPPLENGRRPTIIPERYRYRKSLASQECKRHQVTGPS